jgi:CheY-like chemotaxis protein
MQCEPHILVLEDKPADYELMQREFDRAELHCTTTCVASGDAVFRELSAHPPDVIVSEDRLVWADGPTLFHLVRNRCPDTPFILVTGTTIPLKQARECQCCVDDCVPRACLAGLVPAICRALRLAEERRRLRQVERERDRLRDEVASLRHHLHPPPAPIHVCRSCNKAEVGDGNWTDMNIHLLRRIGIESDPGLCPECADAYFGASVTRTTLTRAGWRN